MNLTKGQKDPHRYDDMLDLSHPVSKKHKQMPVSDRAAQFAPFAALSGYGEQVEDTAKNAYERIVTEEAGEAFEESP